MTSLISTLCLVTPNSHPSRGVRRGVVLAWIVAGIAGWVVLRPAVIPGPGEVGRAMVDLWTDGFVGDLYTSVVLYFQAMTVATVYSLAVVYASTLPVMTPVAEGWSKLRFLGMVGLPFLFTLYIASAHNIKLALLTFSISVFMATGMLDIVRGIPRENYDLARTLRMGEWRVLWEVVVLGQMDQVFDAMRQNGAMGWAMLPLVESLFRFEGGVGAVLMTQSKYFHLSEVAAISITVVGIGIGQDYAIAGVKRVVCPWADMGVGR